VITRMELGKEQPEVVRIPYHTTEAMSRFAPSLAARGEYGFESGWLAFVASSLAEGRFLAVRDQNAVVTG
jgi:hypothetical protein